MSNYPPGAREALDKIEARQQEYESACEAVFVAAYDELKAALVTGSHTSMVTDVHVGGTGRANLQQVQAHQIVNEDGEDTPAILTLLSRCARGEGGDALKAEAMEIIDRIAMRHATWCADKVESMR